MKKDELGLLLLITTAVTAVTSVYLSLWLNGLTLLIVTIASWIALLTLLIAIVSPATRTISLRQIDMLFMIAIALASAVSIVGSRVGFAPLLTPLATIALPLVVGMALARLLYTRLREQYPVFIVVSFALGSFILSGLTLLTVSLDLPLQIVILLLVLLSLALNALLISNHHRDFDKLLEINVSEIFALISVLVLGIVFSEEIYSSWGGLVSGDAWTHYGNSLALFSGVAPQNSIRSWQELPFSYGLPSSIMGLVGSGAVVVWYSFSLMIWLMSVISFYVFADRISPHHFGFKAIATYLYVMASGLGWVIALGLRVGATTPNDVLNKAGIYSFFDGLLSFLGFPLGSFYPQQLGVLLTFALISFLSVSSDFRRKRSILMGGFVLAFILLSHPPEYIMFTGIILVLALARFLDRNGIARALWTHIAAIGVVVAVALAFPQLFGWVPILFGTIEPVGLLGSVVLLVAFLQSKMSLSNTLAVTLARLSTGRLGAILLTCALLAWSLSLVIVERIASSVNVFLAYEGPLPWYFYFFKLGVLPLLAIIPMKRDLGQHSVATKIGILLALAFFLAGKVDSYVIQAAEYTVPEVSRFFSFPEIRVFDYARLGVIIFAAGVVTELLHHFRIRSLSQRRLRAAAGIFTIILVISSLSTYSMFAYWYTAPANILSSSVRVNSGDRALFNFIQSQPGEFGVISTSSNLWSKITDYTSKRTMGFGGQTQLIATNSPFNASNMRMLISALELNDVQMIVVDKTAPPVQGALANLLKYVPSTFVTPTVSVYSLPKMQVTIDQTQPFSWFDQESGSYFQFLTPYDNATEWIPLQIGGPIGNASTYQRIFDPNGSYVRLGTGGRFQGILIDTQYKISGGDSWQLYARLRAPAGLPEISAFVLRFYDSKGQDITPRVSASGWILAYDNSTLFEPNAVAGTGDWLNFTAQIRTVSGNPYSFSAGIVYYRPIFANQTNAWVDVANVAIERTILPTPYMAYQDSELLLMMSNFSYIPTSVGADHLGQRGIFTSDSPLVLNLQRIPQESIILNLDGRFGSFEDSLGFQPYSVNATVTGIVTSHGVFLNSFNYHGSLLTMLLDQNGKPNRVLGSFVTQGASFPFAVTTEADGKTITYIFAAPLLQSLDTSNAFEILARILTFLNQPGRVGEPVADSILVRSPITAQGLIKVNAPIIYDFHGDFMISAISFQRDNLPSLGAGRIFIPLTACPLNGTLSSDDQSIQGLDGTTLLASRVNLTLTSPECPLTVYYSGSNGTFVTLNEKSYSFSNLHSFNYLVGLKTIQPSVDVAGLLTFDAAWIPTPIVSAGRATTFEGSVSCSVIQMGDGYAILISFSYSAKVRLQPLTSPSSANSSPLMDNFPIDSLQPGEIAFIVSCVVAGWIVFLVENNQTFRFFSKPFTHTLKKRESKSGL